MYDFIFPGLKLIAETRGCEIETNFLSNEYIFKKGNEVHKKRLTKKYVYQLAQENKYDKLAKEVSEICEGFKSNNSEE